MNLNEMAMNLLQEYLRNSLTNPQQFYDDAMELLRGIAIEKNIEFDDYFQTRWEKSAETIINFDEKYFADPKKRDLYAILSAQIDEEIFKYLNFVWNNYYHEKLTLEILKNKENELLKMGIKF